MQFLDVGVGGRSFLSDASVFPFGFVDSSRSVLGSGHEMVSGFGSSLGYLDPSECVDF